MTQQLIVRQEFARLDLAPGTVYQSQRHNCHNRCVIVCEARDTHSLQDRVVYQVVGGRDHGRCFSVGPMAFALNFVRVQEEAKGEMVEERAAVMTEGSGF